MSIPKGKAAVVQMVSINMPMLVETRKRGDIYSENLATL